MYTIVALGELNFSNGLPAFGEGGEYKKVALRSGEALHFRGDVKRAYNRRGGIYLLFQWKNASD